MRSINGDRDWANIHRSALQCALTPTWNIFVASDCAADSTHTGAALAIAGLVGVGGFGVVAAVRNDEPERAVHEPTAAALVAITTGAVDQLLLAERDQSPCLERVLALHGARGAERPAGAALALILDRRHDTLVAPVDGSGEGGGGGWLVELGRVVARRGTVAVVDAGELGALEVGEFVDGQRVAEFVCDSVVLVDELLVGLPNGMAAQLLQLGGVYLSVQLGGGGGGGSKMNDAADTCNFALVPSSTGSTARGSRRP